MGRKKTVKIETGEVIYLALPWKFIQDNQKKTVKIELPSFDGTE
jgi:hypothetical protein